MSPVAETTLDGFTVTVERMKDENDPARGEWNDCYVAKGRHSASLACLEDFGYIEVDGGVNIPVKPQTLENIRAFAEKHGYDG